MMRTIILVALLTTIAAAPVAAAVEDGEEPVEYSTSPPYVKVNGPGVCVVITQEFPFVSVEC